VEAAAGPQLCGSLLVRCVLVLPNERVGHLLVRLPKGRSSYESSPIPVPSAGMTQPLPCRFQTYATRTICQRFVAADLRVGPRLGRPTETRTAPPHITVHTLSNTVLLK
jgi:hypothetical protein